MEIPAAKFLRDLRGFSSAKPCLDIYSKGFVLRSEMIFETRNYGEIKDTEEPKKTITLQKEIVRSLLKLSSLGPLERMKIILDNGVTFVISLSTTRQEENGEVIHTDLGTLTLMLRS